MSVTFQSTLVETLEAFIYYNSDYESAGPTVKQPFNNSPSNSSAEQYGYVTGNASDGISIKYTNSFVSIQGTDAVGNIYYWVSFSIDPSTTAQNLNVITITEPNTVIDLDTKLYYKLYACNSSTQCPNGLSCYNDPITKKNYCVGIGVDGTNWVLIIVMVIILLVILAIAGFLTFKLFHVINVRK